MTKEDFSKRMMETNKKFEDVIFDILKDSGLDVGPSKSIAQKIALQNLVFSGEYIAIATEVIASEGFVENEESEG